MSFLHRCTPSSSYVVINQYGDPGCAGTRGSPDSSAVQNGRTTCSDMSGARGKQSLAVCAALGILINSPVTAVVGEDRRCMSFILRAAFASGVEAGKASIQASMRAT